MQLQSEAEILGEMFARNIHKVFPLLGGCMFNNEASRCGGYWKAALKEWSIYFKESGTITHNFKTVILSFQITMNEQWIYIF